MKTILILILFSASVYAQYPFYFYAFELKDSEGNFIDSASSNYKMKTILCSDCKEIGSDVSICESNQTWRYYVGGNYKYLDKTNSLRIDKVSEGAVIERMTIEFPAPVSADGRYMHLYAGVIKFRKGTYKIELPESAEEWNKLKELKLCPDSINPNYSFRDISKFQ